MKLKHLSLLLTVIMIFSCGCGQKKEPAKVVKKAPVKVETPEPKPIVYYSPFTHEVVSKEISEAPEYFAIIENSKDARPQSGLTKADIIYETLAEGGIPRFIALFQKNTCAKLGPIRSARPYFIDIAKDYNLSFAHCGGSEEALERVSNEKLLSINEMQNGSTFYRSTDRKAPHNLYTTSDSILQFIKNKGLNSRTNIGLSFNDSYYLNSALTPCNSVLVKTGPYYKTSYDYKNGYYEKSMDGTPATDKETGEVIKTKNIVIQITDIILQKDNLHHLTIRLTGEGDAFVISNGKLIKGKWVKDPNKQGTNLKDLTGLEIPLSSGNTIWHIVDKNTVLDPK